ncbi:OPT family small oligopeptide transporter [Botrytis cinerea]
MSISFLTRRSKSKTASVEIEVDERSTPNEGSSHDEKSRPATTGPPVPLSLPPSRHSLDPNLPDSFPIQSMTSRTAISPDLDPEKDLEIPIDISLNSPYPQVRAAVRNTGKGWDLIVPDWSWEFRVPFCGTSMCRIRLKEGKWNMKEHAIVVVMANAGFFMARVLGSFVWYFFPGWIFRGLSYFTFACWIAPRNPVVNQLFGGVTGLGLIPITFDWTVPWYAIANTLIGLLIFVIISSLGVHYTGTCRILTANYEFGEELYEKYSPIFFVDGVCVELCVIVHTILYEGRTIWRQWKFARDQDYDIHMKLMKKYKDAPDWWYITLGAVMLALSFVVILVWDTHFPWWAFIVCVAIPVIWTVPVGIIFATTNIQIGLNVFTEFVIGYMLPGRPVALMLFKAYGYITMTQAQFFLQDLKLGHYLKVPPRTMFSAQCVAAFWSSIVQIANYITSAALDTGLILCTLLIFFTLELTNAKPPQWFGNVDVFETMDMQGTAVRKVLAEGETFGPETWS